MRHVNGIEDLGMFRVLGQPNLNFEVDREQAARYQINVADVQDAIQTAVGGNAVTQVLQGERATTSCSAISRNTATPRRRSRISACSRPPANASPSRSSAKSKSRTAARRSTAKTTSVT